MGKESAAARAYGAGGGEVDGAVDALVAAREALARAEREELPALERAVERGDAASVGRARAALGWQLAAARQSLRDAEARDAGDEAGWVREEAGRVHAELARLDDRADALGADSEAPACQAAPDGRAGAGLSVADLLAEDRALRDLEKASASGDDRRLAEAWAAREQSAAASAARLAAAEAAAFALPPEQRAAELARIAAARSLQSVEAARAQQVLDEGATSGPADLELSRDRIELPATEVGRQSGGEPVSIRNQGPRPVALDGLSGPAEFPVDGTCERALGPGEAVELRVSFRPSETGRRHGALRVETDGGVRSARLLVRGEGIEPSQATLAAARIDRAAAGARGEDPLPRVHSFAAMRDLLHAARQLDGVGDREAALRALVAVRDSLAEVANDARASEVYGRFGFGRTGLDMMRGGAVQAVKDLVACLVGHLPMLWEHRLLAFDAGQESIELLTGERSDSPGARAMHSGGTLTAGVAGGILGGLAAAPLIAGELGLLGSAGAAAWRSMYLWGVANPATAVAASSAATGLAVDMADKGGFSAWLESAATWEGVLGIAFDALQIYDAHLSARAASTGSEPAGAEDVEAPAAPGKQPAPAEPADPDVAPVAGPGRRAEPADPDVGPLLGELHHVAANEVLEGSRDQILRAVSEIRARYPEVEIHADPAAGRWRVALGPRSLIFLQNQGRKLPTYAVRESDIVLTETSAPGDTQLRVIFKARGADGADVHLATGVMNLRGDGSPADHPYFSITPKVNGSADFAVQIYDDVRLEPGTPRPVGVGSRTPLTQHVLSRFIQLHEERFGRKPYALDGMLAYENLFNFQKEYARLIRADVHHALAAEQAIRRISYGQHREALGYGRFVVHATDPKPVDLGGDLGIQRVPTLVEATGYRSVEEP